jgi:hypothetical protein
VELVENRSPRGRRKRVEDITQSDEYRQVLTCLSPRLRSTVDRVPEKLSHRLAAIVEALPLRPESRVLEIGCGPGAAARAAGDPAAGEVAIRRIALATTPDARLFVDGGDPLRELTIPRD